MIDRHTVLRMIEHWLNHPPNSYFGWDYGAPISSLFLTTLSAPVANTFIEKMRKDLPVLNMFSNEDIAIYVDNVGFEQKKLYLKIGNLPVVDLSVYYKQQKSQSGETFNANAS